jgi:hypothetical protein
MKLSPTELKSIHNANFFYTKASIIKKIDTLLAQVRDEIRAVIQKQKLHFPDEVDAITGKIFRGENYLGLPYLNLDYPKYFSGHSVLACRTLFWWGKFFSFTLHLQGKPLDERRTLLILNRKKLRKKQIYISVNSTPWHYYYKRDNYMLIDRFRDKELIRHFTEKEFIKLSAKIELKDYQKLPQFAAETFTLFSFLFGPPAPEFDTSRAILSPIPL